MPNFRPFSACWGDISFTQAPKRPCGATQGRYFFHANPRSTPGVADTGGTEHTSRRKAWPRCSWAAAGPGRTTSRRTEHTSATRHHWCGGRRRVRRARAGFEIDHSERSSRVAISRAAGPDGARNTSGAASNKLNREFRLRRPWAATGPGRTTRRRTQAPPVWRAPEGPEGARGPGRGAGGWRQGQGGPRDRPLRAVRLACGDLAGGPPPTGTHSGRAPQSSPAQQVRPSGARNTSGATSTAGNQAISGSRAPSGSPTLRQHPSARAGAPNRRQPARGPRPRR